MLPVDTKRFQFGVISDVGYDETEERDRLDELSRRARRIIQDQPWAPPIQDLLAFGVFDVIGLYLIRFERPVLQHNGDWREEMWLVLGDMPVAFFTTDTSRTRADALRIYCDQMEEWADAVLAGGDLSECWDADVEPTEEHAWMLKGRVELIRQHFIPDLEETSG